MIEVWSELDHTNVLPLIWTTEDHGRFSMVSPWAENGTLTSYLEGIHGELIDVQILTLVCKSTLAVIQRIEFHFYRSTMSHPVYNIVSNAASIFHITLPSSIRFSEQCIRRTSRTVGYPAYVVPHSYVLASLTSHRGSIYSQMLLSTRTG